MNRDTISSWRRRSAVLLLVAGCLTAGLARPAAASAVSVPLTGLEPVSDTSASNSNWVKGASVTCPDNKVVVGTGWSISPASSQLRLQFLKPYEHSVMAQAYEEYYDGYDSNWSLTVRAMCADRPPGWTLLSYQDTADSDDYHSARRDCPHGLKPLAAGVEHMVPHGQVVVTDVDLDLTGARVSAYEAEDGYDEDWWIKVYTICSQPPTGWALWSSSNQTSYPSTSEYAECLDDRVAISAGVDLNGAYGEVVLKSLKTFVQGGRQFGAATASEDLSGAPDSWELETDVICVGQ